MAKCQVCQCEMLTANGCAVNKIHIGGKAYERIPVGGKGDWGKDEGANYVCSDCGAHQGGFHHWGCDVERCPACGRQLISCDCENVFVEGPDEE
ncbi:MAG: hypothetical protein RSE58_06195 [Clostridia bacterium]